MLRGAKKHMTQKLLLVHRYPRTFYLYLKPYAFVAPPGIKPPSGGAKLTAALWIFVYSLFFSPPESWVVSRLLFCKSKNERNRGRERERERYASRQQSRSFGSRLIILPPTPSAHAGDPWITLYEVNNLYTVGCLPPAIQKPVCVLHEKHEVQFCGHVRFRIMNPEHLKCSHMISRLQGKCRWIFFVKGAVCVHLQMRRGRNLHPFWFFTTSVTHKKKKLWTL